MGFTDTKLRLCDSTNLVTASGWAANSIDLSVARDIAEGQDVTLNVSPGAAITPAAGNTAVEFQAWAASSGATASQAAGLGSVFTVTLASPGVFTLNNHGFVTGQAVTLFTTGALPTGLTAGVIYFVIFVSTNTFQVATTLANALAGTGVNTSVSQSGTHTLTALKLVGTSGPIKTEAMVYSATAGAFVSPPVSIELDPLLGSIGLRYLTVYFVVTGGPLTGVSAFTIDPVLAVNDGRKTYPTTVNVT